jgi:hypothetical protein
MAFNYFDPETEAYSQFAAEIQTKFETVLTDTDENGY